jgi:2-polyprenyl-3-methyl-5-hydroxy-6-metoxy-1,4-benzoquinol methylase
MPTSDPLLLTPVVKQIVALQPQSILDIGIGFGKWGALAREYTDVWVKRPVNVVRIDGVEIFEKYRSVNWGHYDHIYIGHISDILPKLESYDMILFLEVLEHIEKIEALELLEICRSKCKTLIFSYTNTPQGPAFGNIHETHLSTWAEKDFDFPLTLMAGNGYTYVYKAGGV